MWQGVNLEISGSKPCRLFFLMERFDFCMHGRRLKSPGTDFLGMEGVCSYIVKKLSKLI